MKISIIIPTYRRTAFLAGALASVAQQDFPKDDYEVLVVDNAETPTPGLVVLCESFSSPPVRYINEPRNGLHQARHAGARKARGDILVYIDDDVICPQGWLSAMVRPFENLEVAMVAGKVILRYESSPPDWLLQFVAFLSEFDCGNEPQAMESYASAVGCNMAVRKSVLFDVGGFNPDAFGDRSLIRYRGDGECGLARKIHDANLVIWYSPEAVLEHHVPESRISREYVGRRAENSGIEAVYHVYRYRVQHTAALMGLGLKYAAKGLCHWALMLTRKRKSPAWFRHHVASLQHFQSVVQCVRLVCSKKLRVHTKSPTYLI